MLHHITNSAHCFMFGQDNTDFGLDRLGHVCFGKIYFRIVF